MASFLQRALDLPSSGTNFFGDDQGSVHEAAINAIAETGITEGCNTNGTRFCPSQALTRGQMASLLVRAFAFPASSADAFIDDGASVHETAINAIAAAGITAGCDDAGIRFCPEEAIRRDQMASFLARALGLMATGPFACTRVVGFSQTEQWFTGGGFEPVAGDARWELLWESGATIEKWADPGFVGWSNQVVSGCKEEPPSRLLLTVTGAQRPLARWIEDIASAVSHGQGQVPRSGDRAPADRRGSRRATVPGCPKGKRPGLGQPPHHRPGHRDGCGRTSPDWDGAHHPKCVVAPITEMTWDTSPRRRSDLSVSKSPSSTPTDLSSRGSPAPGARGGTRGRLESSGPSESGRSRSVLRPLRA